MYSAFVCNLKSCFEENNQLLKRRTAENKYWEEPQKPVKLVCKRAQILKSEKQEVYAIYGRTRPVSELLHFAHFQD